jgi:hypothetical protein
MIVDISGFEWRKNHTGYEIDDIPPEALEGDEGAFERMLASYKELNLSAPSGLRRMEVDGYIPDNDLTYKPLEKVPNLFYKLAITPLTEAGIIDFATKYGFLGLNFRMAEGFVYGFEDTHRWLHEIRQLKEAYDLWVDMKSQGPDAPTKYENWSRDERLEYERAKFGKGELEVTEDSFEKSFPFLDDDGFRTGYIKGQSIGQSLSNSFSLGLSGNTYGATSVKSNGEISVSLIPGTLIGAIWFQFAQAASSGRWKDCAYCSEPFEFKNKSAMYCSKSHKTMAIRNRNANGKKPT